MAALRQLMSNPTIKWICRWILCPLKCNVTVHYVYLCLCMTCIIWTNLWAWTTHSTVSSPHWYKELQHSFISFSTFGDQVRWTLISGEWSCRLHIVVANWGIPLAAIGDAYYRGPEIISGRMTVGECCEDTTHVITAANSIVHILAAVHAVLTGRKTEKFVALLLPCY